MKPALAAALFFLSDQEILQIDPFGTGNVNDTFLVTLANGETMVLQRINPDVFPEPQIVQSNIRLVTDHLLREMQSSPELAEQNPLTLYSGKGGDTLEDADGAVWRMVNHIPGTTRDTVSLKSQAFELGHSLGNFHRLLSTLAPEKLADTLPGFHDTPACLAEYDGVRKNRDIADPEEEWCNRFIDSHRHLATGLEDADLSRGIIHGDPKVANFIFDKSGEKVVSLIDLDTVRPGLLLHDIGDGLRSCCNPRGETPSEPDEIHFDHGLFSAWLEGYGRVAGMMLTKSDKEHIVQAVRVIAFELGLRFVTDHLGGDHYFKTSYPGHNLFRARVQFHLVQSIENQLAELRTIVNTVDTLTDNYHHPS